MFSVAAASNPMEMPGFFVSKL
uniref:Uncharacterized protein n=1 Tax=Rhizophora mucronata TaxID=61149 RepID=A0A2P2MXK2_RHIMU